ncbi:MAG: hypothetical protein PHF25_07180, partial [Candidatus Margulisbacteria bacterium]|nr:hypothetical protein [Candidatus Margulisiibacteriota bacterium]
MTPIGTNTLTIGRSPNFELTYTANYPGHELVVQKSTNLTNQSGWQSIETTRTLADGKIQKYPVNITEPTGFFKLYIPIDRSPLITDANLETAIRTSLNLTNEDSLTEGQLATITTLNLNNLGIKTLDGIQYLTGLTSINLTENPIIDYSLLPTTNNGLSSLVTIKNDLLNNDRDNFANTSAPFYVEANTIDPLVTGKLVRYVHPEYLGNIHTEGQWYAGFLLAHQATTAPLNTEQQELLNNIITAGLNYFPNLTINGQETTLQGWIKNDKTSAADADVFKIMTLALTNRSIEAKTCSDDFFKYETKDIQG